MIVCVCVCMRCLCDYSHTERQKELNKFKKRMCITERYVFYSGVPYGSYANGVGECDGNKIHQKCSV